MEKKSWKLVGKLGENYYLCVLLGVNLTHQLKTLNKLNNNCNGNFGS